MRRRGGSIGENDVLVPVDCTAEVMILWEGIILKVLRGGPFSVDDKKDLVGEVVEKCCIWPPTPPSEFRKWSRLV